MARQGTECDSQVWCDEPSVETSDYVHINLHEEEAPHQSSLTIRQHNTVDITETHTFPSKIPDWSNLEVLHRNTLPPRSSFFVYDSVPEALTRDVSKSKTLSLSGDWKFSLSKSPFDVEPDFFSPTFDAAAWGKIRVPGMWQLQGYGKGPQFVFHSNSSISYESNLISDIPTSITHFLSIPEKSRMIATRQAVI